MDKTDKEVLELCKSWFNVISPHSGNMEDLKKTLKTLKNKDWRAIL